MLRLQQTGRARFAQGVGAFVFMLGSVAFFLGDYLKDEIADHTAEVATKSISNPELAKQSEAVAKQVVSSVLTDAATLEQVQKFLLHLFGQEYTVELLVALVLQVLRDPGTLDEVQKLSQGVVNKVLENEDTTRLVVALLQKALQDPATVQSFLEFLEYVFAQDITRDALMNLVNSVMATDGFLKSTAEMRCVSFCLSSLLLCSCCVLWLGISLFHVFSTTMHARGSDENLLLPHERTKTTATRRRIPSSTTSGSRTTPPSFA